MEGSARKVDPTYHVMQEVALSAPPEPEELEHLTELLSGGGSVFVLLTADEPVKPKEGIEGNARQRSVPPVTDREGAFLVLKEDELRVGAVTRSREVKDTFS